MDDVGAQLGGFRLRLPPVRWFVFLSGNAFEHGVIEDKWGGRIDTVHSASVYFAVEECLVANPRLLTTVDTKVTVPGTEGIASVDFTGTPPVDQVAGIPGIDSGAKEWL